MHADDEEEDEKKALYLMISLLLRGHPEENILRVYEEHQVRNTCNAVVTVTLNY